VDPVVVAAQQLIERETIAALCGGDQGGVIELARNAASVTNGSETPRDVIREAVGRDPSGLRERPALPLILSLTQTGGGGDPSDLREPTSLRPTLSLTQTPGAGRPR
jgi:hypothetical protein